ncbi:hypothetical protein WG622_02570 [Cognatishimia sp. D5M38]|uniref:Uncharacterized protein n=1 Tax=Cognatishimia coralii TaxID=3083254 RepID=A0ABU8QCJ9_9RHOB
MSIWDGIPYELQSPTWRNAGNKTNRLAGEWDPSLNTDMATTFLDHQYRVAKAAGETNTVQVDGTAGFVNMLSGFANQALNSMGVQPEQTMSNVHPAAFGRRDAGLSDNTLIIVGLVAAGLYFATKA